jgi:aminoglycoside phosphotransferase (APT) family kinase protein
MEVIDEALVHGLLREQRPELADLPLRFAARGWDNELWRLGEELAVRVPRTEHAPELLRKEHKWLPLIAPRLPLPVPTPLFLGEPTDRFPQPWSVVEWVDGEPADRAEIDNEDSAAILAGFLRALHSEEPLISQGDGWPRGGIRNASCEFSDDLVELIGLDQIRQLEDIWRDGREAPDWSGPRVWAHKDLHPANVVTKDGALSGVIDFGDLSPGDPASDLAAAWILLPTGSTSAFFAHYGDVDPATMRRARAFAVRKSAFVVQMGINGLRGIPGGKPGWLSAGRKSLDRVLGLC